MKNLLLTLAIFLIFSALSFSQEHNPDGYGPSIHFTPYLNWGAYSDKAVNHEFDYDLDLGFSVAIKIPMSNSFTLGAFYERNPFSISSSSGAIIADGKSLLADGYHSYAGVRFSIYFGSKK